MANPLPAIEGAASNVANGNRIKSTSSMPCYLLELPWEVRNRILRYLLYSDQALRLLEREVDDDENESDESEDEEDDHSEAETDDLNLTKRYYKNYSFSLQVMRTCHQLCSEGKLVLDSNTIGIDLCRYSDDKGQWAVAGNRQKECVLGGIRLDQKIKRMFHQAEKFHIFMSRQELYADNADDDQEYLYFSPAPQLCRCFVRKQNLKQCRIGVTVGGWGIGGKLFSAWEDWSFLASFYMLRCKEFSINGCDENLAQKLQRAILADEPARNLWAMHDALQSYVRVDSCLRDDYIRKLGPWDFYAFDPEVPDDFGRGIKWGLIQEAVVWGDVQKFLSLRSALLEAINNYQAKKECELLELDSYCEDLDQEEEN